MKEEKEIAKKNSVKKAYLKTLGVLECICSDCHVSFAENFSKYEPGFAETKDETQLQNLTSEMKASIVEMMKAFYVGKWADIAKKAYNEKEFNEMLSTLTLMIEMEPVYSYEHFIRLFDLMNGLNSEKEEEVMNTLFQIRENAAVLSTEDIINSYTELTRTKYKDGVVYAIIDGVKKGPHKKHSEYIACYFNDKSLIGEKTMM